MAFLFGKKKKENEEQASQMPVVREDPKKQLDITRQNMVKMLSALDTISINKIRASVSEEILSNAELSEFDRDLKTVKAVIGKQTSSQLMLAESDAIDQELLFFAEHIEDEMCQGHFLVSETYMKAIKFGISKGHEAIKESDIENKDDILNQRLEIIKHYKLIAELNRKIAAYQDSMVKLNEKLAKLQSDYSEAKSIAKEESIRRKDMYDKIIRMSPAEVATATPEIQNFAAIFSTVNELKSQINGVKTSISGMNSNVQEIKRAIGNTENALLSINSITTEKEREEIERVNRQYIENMKSLQDQVFEFEDLFSELDASIDAINSDPRIIRKMLKDMTSYRNIVHQDEIDQKAEEEGMKAYEEYLRKQQEQLDDDIRGMEEDLDNDGINNEPEKHKISN